jgi:hypothetical protein
MHALVKAYGEARPNLLLHDRGFPEAAALDRLISSGQPEYGMAATGPGKSSAGSAAAIRAVDRDDERPVWVLLWGGANTLAQALIDVRASRPSAEMDRFVSRLRVYSISDQDDAGAWIRREFPNLFYIAMPSDQGSGDYYYATWTGISGDKYYRNGAGADAATVTNEWLDVNIRNKGPLGKVYPKFMFIMEGDTPTFLGLLNNGLYSYRRPDWGGWGGRYVLRQPRAETHAFWTQGGDLFSRVTSQDTVTGADGREYISDQATIWRWREAFQNDFAARMDWTITGYRQANHNPVVEVNGQVGNAPIRLEVPVGGMIELDATKSSDPDNNLLTYRWFHYPEAGGTGASLAAVTIERADSPRVSVTATAACRPQWLGPARPCPGPGVAHVILAVTDNGKPKLTSYRRIILTVKPVAQ